MRILGLTIAAFLLAGPPAQAQTQIIGCVATTGRNCTDLIEDAVAGNSGVLTSAIDVTSEPCGTQKITDVAVSVNLIHDYVGDLSLRLTSAAGTEVLLLDGPGSCGSDDINTVFRDKSSRSSCDSLNPAFGRAPLEPASPLSVLAEDRATGRWSLHITDHVNTGIGTLNDWALVFSCGALPTVTVTAIDASGAETGGNTITFRFTRSTVTPTELPVTIVFSGTASLSDFTPNPTSVTIPADQASVDLILTPVNDGVAEPAESVIVTAPGGATYGAGSPSSAMAAIADPSGPAFDPNGDTMITIADVLYLLNYLFGNGPAPLGPADANDDTAVNILDVFYTINYFFAGGPQP